MEKKTWFERVKNLVYGQREKDHGDPKKMFKITASWWRKYLRDKHELIDKYRIYSEDYPVWIDAEDVCVMLVLLKLVRSMTGDRNNEDHLMDAMGYIGLIERLRNETKR